MNQILEELKGLPILIYSHLDIFNTLLLIFIFAYIIKYTIKEKTTLNNLNQAYNDHENLVEQYIKIIGDKLKNHANKISEDIHNLQSETLQAINDNVGLIGEIYKNSVVSYQNDNIERINFEITKPLEDIIKKIDGVNIKLDKNYKIIHELRETNNTLSQTINRRDKANHKLKEEIRILKSQQKKS